MLRLLSMQLFGAPKVFVSSSSWLAFGVCPLLAPFFDVCLHELKGISIWQMSALFDHATRKSWFLTVFGRIFEPWAYVERVFLYTFLSCFCKFLMVMSIWGVGVSFGYVMVMHDENLDFVWCFQHFRAVGTSRKGVCSSFFHITGEVYVWWACGFHLFSACSFQALQTRNRGFVLLFIGFMSCGHLLKKVPGFLFVSTSSA